MPTQDDFLDGAVTCCHCRDVVEGRLRHKGGPCCQECFEELVHGIIKDIPVHFIGGIAATMEDDSGPWQQNAIRVMEGG